MFNATRAQAWRELSYMVKEGYLRREGERKATIYLPGPSLGAQAVEHNDDGHVS
jgi:hypothetical protein